MGCVWCVFLGTYLLEALLDEARPIVDGVAHAAAVDVIKFLAVGPVGFSVVDFESDVWRDPEVFLSEFAVCEMGTTKIPVRLYGAEIVAKNLD